jgi:iron complex outermembrane receptor protein
VNLHSSYSVTDNFELFFNIRNIFNARYNTFGVFGDPTGVGAPGVPANGSGVDNRFVAPSAPISIFGGIRLHF